LNHYYKHPSGKTALYNAIFEASTLHQKALRRCNPIFYSIVETHSKWIVALTDGEDTSSLLGYEKLSEKLRRAGINLIIIGIAVDLHVKKILSGLCRFILFYKFL
jgi:hypothetical protein